MAIKNSTGVTLTWVSTGVVSFPHQKTSQGQHAEVFVLPTALAGDELKKGFPSLIQYARAWRSQGRTCYRDSFFLGAPNNSSRDSPGINSQSRQKFNTVLSPMRSGRRSLQIAPAGVLGGPTQRIDFIRR